MKASTKKDPKTIAAAIFIALIVLAGIVLVAVNAFGGDTNKGAGPVGATPSQGARSSSPCGLADGVQAMPTEAPATKWALDGKMAAPRSSEFGPSKVASSVHSCFARNPFGALFAVSNFYTDALGGAPISEAFVERWFTDGPAKEKARAAVSAPSTKQPVPQQIVGFRLDSYSSDRTTVTLVTQETDGPTSGELRTFPTTVVWSSGDWRVDADNTTDGVPTRVPSLSGYIKWSGVS